MAAGVARVDDGVDVLALQELGQELQPRLGLLDRPQVEMGRNDGQVRERPLPAFDLVIVGRNQLEEVADGGRNDVFVVFEVLIDALEAAENARDVARDGRLFRNDQSLGHSHLE